AREFALRQPDARGFRGDGHLTQELGADLVPEPARAAVDGDHHLALAQTECRRDLGIDDVDDLLHLEVVVARAEGAHLAALALPRPARDELRTGIARPAAFLDARDVTGLAIAARPGPAGAAGPQRGHLVVVEAKLPPAA